MRTLKTSAVGFAAMIAVGITGTAAVSAKERHRHHKDDDKAAAAVAGALIVGAIAVAASKKKKRDRDYYYHDDRRYYRDHNWGNTFRPKRDVICYRNARICYRKGHYSSKWTVREFGYDRRY